MPSKYDWRTVLHGGSQMNTPTVKALIVAAGDGTRAVELTGGNSKEMLTCWDRPAINLIITECLQAGITDIVVVSNRRKLDLNHWVEGTHPKIAEWEDKQKNTPIDACQEISKKVNVQVVYQDEPLGLGHAVLVGREAIGNSPFVVLLPDEMMVDLTRDPDSDAPSPTSELVELGKQGYSGATTQLCDADKVGSYGRIEHKQGSHETLSTAVELLEKVPAAPGDIEPKNIIIGRYVFQPEIFDYLADLEPGAGGELQLTDGMKAFVRDGHELLVTELRGDFERFDIGGIQGYKSFIGALSDAEQRGISIPTVSQARDDLYSRNALPPVSVLIEINSRAGLLNR